ncbi:MAG: type II toxin-antitoxin system VapC family toxin [Candidatus Omnitrophica bacterium]|nr:type II toxin-antitoxin system VapC family toxin [Candidatus Omnitrophota bacterium]MCA9436799.1 type II toxin-antitoxin system VapC family toxin [Candidatus Omnitrophota bacterium]
MIGVDTNILVRLIVQDEPSQFKKALRLIQEVEVGKEQLFINDVVLAELSWVLSATYEYSKEEIAGVLERMVSNPSIVLRNPDLVVLAIRSFRSSSADFSDCLLNSLNQAQGCETTYTFDKKASKLPGMKLA